MQRWPFPNPVNTVAARLVAAGVCLQLLGVFLGWHWLLLPLAYGFLARVTTGPAFSPLGKLASGAGTRYFPDAERVPGPPKRFAQAVGLTLSSIALVGWLFGSTPLWVGACAFLAVGASLEAGLGICMGCIIFQGLMRLGIIPERICFECANFGSTVALPETAVVGSN